MIAGLAMPQGGRAPPAKKGAAGSQGQSQQTKPNSSADDKTWQRSSGGFSGAAKKEYLKWKRQQKAARRADSSDDDGDAGSKHHTQRPQHKPASSTHMQQPTSAQQQPDRQKQRTAPSAADAAELLQYRPLAAVPAEPFAMPAQTADSSASSPTSTTAPGSGPAAAGALDVPGGSSIGSSGRDGANVTCSAEGEPARVIYMPRVDLAEVGFTPEGFTLTMPTRAKWQVGADARVWGQLAQLAFFFQ
jgi:hypothetical protein